MNLLPNMAAPGIEEALDVMRNEERETQIANQQGMENSNWQGEERNKKLPSRNMENKIKTQVNQGKKTKWTRNGGMENPIQGLNELGP